MSKSRQVRGLSSHWAMFTALRTRPGRDARRGFPDTGAVFLARCVMCKNRRAREHEMRAWENVGGIIALFVAADTHAILLSLFLPWELVLPSVAAENSLCL